jgi:hypothetical protein
MAIDRTPGPAGRLDSPAVDAVVVKRQPGRKCGEAVAAAPICGIVIFVPL